jgi:hypothetical protein
VVRFSAAALSDKDGEWAPQTNHSRHSRFVAARDDKNAMDVKRE